MATILKQTSSIAADLAQVQVKDGSYHCTGNWTVQGLAKFTLPATNSTATKWLIDASQITKMDSAGAWLLHKLQRRLAHKAAVEIKGLTPEQQNLVNLVTKHAKQISTKPSALGPGYFFRVGEFICERATEALKLVNFLGEVTVIGVRSLGRFSSLQWKLLCNTVERTGFNALPIVGLLALLIGVVLTYQLSAQLKTYGANMYAVSLLGIAVLREFGPLITAIIIAGRTGSAFAAEIGTMKVNEEIDALKTLGLNPHQLLVLPKILGLMIALPLLTLWADIFGILGGMLMSKPMLGIHYGEFLTHFQQEIQVRHLIIGLCKAPVFAILIAIVGCFQGFQVQGSSDSVGVQTTKSVVISIFLIIIADATFSIIFQALGI